MEWMKTHTPATQASYPYTGMPGACRQASGAGGVRVATSGLAVECVRTLTDRDCNNSDQAGLLAALKKYGPLSVVLDGSNWQFYNGGIYRGTACRHQWAAGNHAVVVVGYGEEAGQHFWLIQNSFGPRWGEQGMCEDNADWVTSREADGTRTNKGLGTELAQAAHSLRCSVCPSPAPIIHSRFPLCPVVPLCLQVSFVSRRTPTRRAESRIRSSTPRSSRRKQLGPAIRSSAHSRSLYGGDLHAFED
jgi:hypothetical protein